MENLGQFIFFSDVRHGWNKNARVFLQLAKCLIKYFYVSMLQRLMIFSKDIKRLGPKTSEKSGSQYRGSWSRHNFIRWECESESLTPGMR